MSESTSATDESADESGDGFLPGFDADNIYHKLRKNEENDLDYRDPLTCCI